MPVQGCIRELEHEEPLERIPCANGPACKESGSMVCSACRLVTYCSKVAHRKSHKQACKNPMRNDGWGPAWVTEGRIPSFPAPGGGNDEEQVLRETGVTGVGCSLWGNTPAMDTINMSLNENDPTKDISLAFIASGDLRDVIKTVNALPENYSGELTVLINDGNMHLACRNLILLLVLGSMDDEAIGTDLALHFWYSILLPAAYEQLLAGAILTFLQFVGKTKVGAPPPFQLTSTSTVMVPMAYGTEEGMLRYLGACNVPPEAARMEHIRIRNVPSQRDISSRLYYNLRPSHRVAFQEYRRTGMLLPFGADHSPYTIANSSLFEEESGKWFQDDRADPLFGRDICEVVATGKEYGASAEDVYGCLYFFLQEQLRRFHQRIRKFRVAFRVTAFEATNLADLIMQDKLSGYGLPSSIRFDRIATSNILDQIFIRTATIVGYFMNWRAYEKAATVDGASKSVNDEIEMEKTNEAVTMYDEMNTLYDNSKPFLTYLKKQGLKSVLRQTGLTLKEGHTIVPHASHHPPKVYRSH
ncbi:hypothetical protein EST38_g2287 [Candolleomyces aberdarensis]|uniref:DUF4470 domain-containing protein n=1 Tax=Candolleomyces aberdarensis TaxID=2316362 RepID=A0A4Q2DSS4_9AGAR|nr:hypothetical protein EST38_g2287 [Candolleomyces aberdarensis]